MKYWILTTEFPPFHGGGISTYCLHTSLMLTERGHEVTVFVPSHNTTHDIRIEKQEAVNVVHFKFEAKEHFNCLGYTAALSYQFAEVVVSHIAKQGVPDYIETQDYHGIGYYLMTWKKLGHEILQNVQIVLTAHAPSFFYLRHNQAPVYSLPDFWTGEMEKWTMKAADIFISPSKYLVEQVGEELGSYKEKYSIVRNPYQLKNKHKAVQQDIAKGDIVFFGKLTYQKGCSILMKFMSELWDQGFEYTLNIIGDDHYFAPRQTGMKDYLLNKYKRHYDEGRFLFEGKLTPEQLHHRLSLAHLIIVPSIVDNFPYVVVESMLLGKVLLISDSGGHAEMIENGKSGFIYNHNNFTSFLEKVHAALELSSEEYTKMGQLAIQRITQMCSYENVYTHKMDILLNRPKIQDSNFPFIAEIPAQKPREVKEWKKNLLSIIVPYFNSGKYISDTIRSIYEVEYPNKEVIVINDGSDDPESLSILYVLQEQYRFDIITQTNQGLATARNTGVKKARGEFIAFLDADDLIHPSFYGRAISLLRQYKNVSFVSSWVRYFDGSTGIWPSQNPEPPFILLHNMVNAGFLCRTIDYFNFGMNDPCFEYGMEDYDANLSLLENGCRGIVIPEPLYHYRIHASSMARGFNKDNQLFLYRLLSQKHEELYSKYASEIFNILLANGPSYLYDNPTIEPATDIITMRKWIKDLEFANQWYRNTLTYYEKQVSIEAHNEKGEPAFQKIFPNGSNYYDDISRKEIKEWYHREYEVLPIWYKRFGHIIKVFQGHRTVKSLFVKENKNK